MALTIYLGEYGAPYTFTDVTNDSQHGVLLEGLPALSMRVEDNFGQFSSGSLAFTANNVDGWWTTKIGSLNPYNRYPLQPWIDIARDGVHRWRGPIDPRSVTFDTKRKLVSFTAIGLMSVLDQFSAENVRRDLPEQSDFGVGVGSAGRLTDSSKTWKKAQFADHVLIDSAGTVFTCQAIVAIGDPDLDYVEVTSGTPASGPYMLRPYCWKTCEEYGAAGTGTLNTLTDTSKAWTPSAWIGYYLHDAEGTVFAITANGATTLTVSGTPATGKYSIRAANHARLMESLGPTPTALGILPGDVLHLACAQQVGVTTRAYSGGGSGDDDPWYKFVWSTPRFGIATQDVTVQYVGPRASNPTLSDQELWLKDDLQFDFGKGDGCYVATPYYRDDTVAGLVDELATEVGYTAATGVESFATNNIVPYADFKNKSVGAALVELATIVNAVVVFDIRGTHPGTITLVVNRRDEPYSNLVKDVSSFLMERNDDTCWELWYDSVKVSGADQREVIVGTPRFGGQTLEVSSDYVSNYTWLRQIAERLSAFFSTRRKIAKVRVLGEYRHPQSYFIVTSADLGLMPPEVYPAWDEISAWVVAGATPYLTCTTGSTPCAAFYLPIAASTDCDLLSLCYASDGSSFPGIGIRVSGAASRNGYFAAFDVTNDRFAVIKWDSGTGSIVAQVTKALAPNTDYYIRFKVTQVAPSSANLQAKIWASGVSEPGSWDIDTYDGGLSSASQPAFYAPSAHGGERFKTFGEYTAQDQIAGFNLLDRVTLEYGGEEWWVIGVDEALADPLPYTELTLLQATGTALTPPDDIETRDASMPEPPSITSITRVTSPKEYEFVFDWDGVDAHVLGFYLTHWPATDPRPDGAGALILPEWVTDHWEYTLPYDPLPVGNTRYVDLQVVMLDGRTSDPCDPEYLP